MSSDDEITSSESEDEDELELKEKMLALEQKKAELEAKRAANSEEQAELEEREKKKEYIRTWGPILILTPLPSAVLAMITIVWVGVVQSAYEVPEGPCADLASPFLPLAVGMCYVFLFVYSWVFVGPKPFKSFRQLMIAYGVIYVFCLGTYALGTMQWVAAMPYKAECPALYNLCMFSIVAFWTCTVVLLLYAVQLKGKRAAAKQKLKNKEKEKKLEEKIRKEEEKKAKKAAKKAAKNAEDEEEAAAAQEEAERAAFYASESDEYDDEREVVREQAVQKKAIA